MQTAHDISGYRKHWASASARRPFLPMSRAEMDALGWDSCDIVLVTGDAYVDHPSFGMAIVGRVLEAQGFRVGMIAQPDWHSAEPFAALGRPNLFSASLPATWTPWSTATRPTAGCAATMPTRPDGIGGKRPDRSVIVYAQRAREAFKDVPIVRRRHRSSLRRIAHYDYWSEKVRRSVLLDAKADLLLYGNGERQIVRDRPSSGGRRIDPRHHRHARHGVRAQIGAARVGSRSTRRISMRRARSKPPRSIGHGARSERSRTARSRTPPQAAATEKVVRFVRRVKNADRDRSVIRMPAFEQVAADPVLYAHASRVLHLEAIPAMPAPSCSATATARCG